MIKNDFKTDMLDENCVVHMKSVDKLRKRKKVTDLLFLPFVFLVGYFINVWLGIGLFVFWVWHYFAPIYSI